MEDKKDKRIVIVGGGFGGIRTALELCRLNPPQAKIVLISDQPHFEYHPALYRVVTGKSPLEVCIPLNEIFKDKNVEVVEDKIVKVDLVEKTLWGESSSKYVFDFCVLALGSETAYFDIPGLKEYSFGLKSISQAIYLKKHLHEVFAACQTAPKEEKVCLVHFVIVGAGATGTELAGALAQYTKILAKNHKIDPSLVTIDLIEAAPKILPQLPQRFSQAVEQKLRTLGVNIFVNRAVLEEEIKEVYLRDMEMKTETVIWTAGVQPNSLYAKIKGLEFDQKGRVLVDEFLQAKGHRGVFIIGDGASTLYSGMAQTAISQGKTVACNIERLIKGKPLLRDVGKKPAVAVPVGEGWAAVIIGPFVVWGFLGWILRRFADLRFFLSILPFRKAILAFQSGKILSEQCPICFTQSA